MRYDHRRIMPETAAFWAKAAAIVFLASYLGGCSTGLTVSAHSKVSKAVVLPFLQDPRDQRRGLDIERRGEHKPY